MSLSGCWARELGLTRSQQASAGPLITSCATAGRVPGSQAPGRGEGPALPGCISLRIAASLVTVSEQRAILTRAGSALLALEPRPTFSLSGGPLLPEQGGWRALWGGSGSCSCCRCLISHQIKTLWSRALCLARQLGPHPRGAPSLPGSQPLRPRGPSPSGPGSQLLRSQGLHPSGPASAKPGSRA